MLLIQSQQMDNVNVKVETPREWTKNKCPKNSFCYVHLEEVIFQASENAQWHNRDDIVDQMHGYHPRQ